MSQYGCTIPRRGRELIAKILAAKLPLKISRIMMGQGVCPDEVFPGDLEDLVEPVAAGTSNEPTYDGDTVHMTVEYRSDLNGGLDHGFWIREFGVFAQDEDGSEVMLYYGVLGDYPQWVSAYSTTGLDVRRYPISITIGEAQIDAHNTDPQAHPAIKADFNAMDARMSLMELRYNTEVSGNPFTATFEDLSKLRIEGVWNAAQKRVEF